MASFLDSNDATFDRCFFPAQCSCMLCSVFGVPTWQIAQLQLWGSFVFLTGIVIPVSSHFSEDDVFLGCIVFDMKFDYNIGIRNIMMKERLVKMLSYMHFDYPIRKRNCEK